MAGHVILRLVYILRRTGLVPEALRITTLELPLDVCNRITEVDSLQSTSQAEKVLCSCRDLL